MNIALDVDGILLDFQRHSHEWAEHLTQRNCPIYPKHYKLDRRYDLSIQEGISLWENLSWHDLPSCQNAHLILDAACQKGEVFFVTAINRKNRNNRLENLSQAFGLNTDWIDKRLYTVNPQHSKRAVLDEFGIDVFVDDHLPNLIQADNGSRILHFVDTGIRIYRESPQHQNEYEGYLNTLKDKPYFRFHNDLQGFISCLDKAFELPKQTAVFKAPKL